ncbi:MAG: HlyD family efflux transporter periplasmic adaptor subunit [Planctomycetales bacterium]
MTTRTTTVALAILAVAIGAGFLVVRGRFGDSQANDARFVTDVAKRGPFVITVNERGELQSLRNATLSSAVEGQSTIISILPEGREVKKGTLVIELDSSQLEEQEKQQRILVTQAEADLRKAEENVEIQKQQNESDLAAARLAQDLAALDLEKFSAPSGEFDQQQNEIKGEIAVAEEELTRANESYEFSKRLAKKGYKTQNDLEADRIAVTRARIKRDVAVDKLKVLQDFTYKRTIKELEEKAAESGRLHERVKRQGRAALAQFEADLQARRLTFEVEEAKMQRLRAQIAACKIHAPQEGRVVYANQQSDRRGDDAGIMEGATVRERQAIVNLPDLTSMKVDVRIHESKISRLREKLPVNIRVTAFNDALYRGVVDSVSAVPASGNWRRSNQKEYEAVVRITEPDLERMTRLKPGLTASVEILVQRRDDILQVPIQAVVTIGTQHYAYVLAQGQTERRDLVIGDTNETAIEIVKGVAEGERLVMNPRTHFAEELSELAAREARDREAEENGEPTTDEAPELSPESPAEGPAPEGRPGEYPRANEPRAAAGPAAEPPPDQTAERPPAPAPVVTGARKGAE